MKISFYYANNCVYISYWWKDEDKIIATGQIGILFMFACQSFNSAALLSSNTFGRGYHY